METENPREDFYKGISTMIKEFSQQDLERLKTVIYNEIFARRKEKADKNNRIIVQPGLEQYKK